MIFIPCFGSKEFHKNNGICKNCQCYEKCKKVEVRKKIDY
jgi:hypothetical protein